MIADRSIKTRRDWKEKVVIPGEADIEEKMVFVREYRQAIDKSGTKIGFCVLMAAYFQMLYEFVIGLEDTMKLVYEDRDFVEEMLEVSTAYWVRFCQAAVANGVDFIWTADDVAFKTGLFLPPKLMRELWLPRLKRIHEPALSAGKPVMFHSDGNIDELVPMLLEAGVDCVHPMDPYGVDYRSFKKKWGGLRLPGRQHRHRVPAGPRHPGGGGQGREEAHGGDEARRRLHLRLQPLHRQLHPPRELHRHAQRHPQVRGVRRRRAGR